ncbi:MAG: aminotransferase class I/II-fold pyridoxal phosphate-dependent enzyme [Prevotellaceae bacterium]|nr:aminotransferase class I/II-fold pyridoxal phosphate-dependent enzyme [Prevotellaceae bacterium]
MIDGHGDDSYRYGDKIKINFSSNIYSHADLCGLKRHLADNLDCIGAYPEPDAFSLSKAIADNSDISPDEVVITNGATEAIYLLAKNYGSDENKERYSHIVKQPTFSEYTDACKMHNLLVNQSFSNVYSPKVYWICNPNNPTGSVIPAEKLLEKVDNSTQDVFIIDQSYEDYTLETMISDKEAVSRHNIILIHSMTKRYCIPGLRIGYIVANNSILNSIRRLRYPWSINSLAIRAGIYLVNNNVRAIPDIHSYLEETARFRSNLNSINGVKADATSTNFFLLHLSKGLSASLKAFLIDEYGILVRDASNFSGLDNRCIRVATQAPDENEALVSGIKNYLEKF